MTGPSTVAPATGPDTVTPGAGPSTPAPGGGPDTVDQALAAVTATFRGMFTTMDGWGAALAGRDWPVAGPSAAQLDLMTRSLVSEELSRPDPTVVGAGFIARPDWVRGAPRYLSWWLGPSNPVGRVPGRPATGIRRLSVAFRDYTTLEWWRVPAATGRPHITGPYVDYLCTDEYTVTLTAPVRIGVDPVGLVGLDIYVRTIESLLLPRLARVGRPATVLNTTGRVVVSTDPHRAAGTVLRSPGLRERLGAADPSGVLPDGGTLLACPGTTLALLLDVD
ncbi:MAG: cache domain-containing protein [Nakamurella sp.]